MENRKSFTIQTPMASEPSQLDSLRLTSPHIAVLISRRRSLGCHDCIDPAWGPHWSDEGHVADVTRRPSWECVIPDIPWDVGPRRDLRPRRYLRLSRRVSHRSFFLERVTFQRGGSIT